MPDLELAAFLTGSSLNGSRDTDKKSVSLPPVRRFRATLGSGPLPPLFAALRSVPCPRYGVCAMAALVGFEGSRSLSASCAPLVAALVASLRASGRGVATGCAKGLDLFVRSACPESSVFRASSFGVGRSSFARRSVALVRAVAASGQGCGFVVFPGRACPAGLFPSSSSSACFCGLGSGSWASAAFAAGLGVPVVVFGLPLSALPPSWGSWVPAGSGVWASGFRLVLPQERLF